MFLIQEKPMRSRILPVLVLALLPFLKSPAFADDVDRSEDEAAIKKVIQDHTEGFNNHDAAAQAKPFTEDADFYSSNGRLHLVGRKKVEVMLKYLHDPEEGIFRNATLKQNVTKIVFISSKTAIVTIEAAITRPNYKNRGLRVMMKVDGVWKFKSYMNQRVTEK